MNDKMAVMQGVLSASVALAGLLLVFCGFVFTQASAFPPETTDDAKIAKYRDAGRLGLWPFLLAIVDALLVAIWLWRPNDLLFCISFAIFVALLVATAVYGVVVTRRYL